MSNEVTTIVDPELTAEEQATADASAQYTFDNVKYLKDADHIRSRPGMYIGDTGTRGLHHLVYELVYNCVDEALAGYCRNIQVILHVDNSCSVSDDGRGIPVEMHPEIGKSTLEAIFTMVGVGGKFDKGAYKVSLGLHGMGAKAVTALSEWVEAQDSARRTHLCAGIRTRQGDHRGQGRRRQQANRDAHPVQTGPDSVSRSPFRFRHPPGTTPRAGLPQQGPGAQAYRRAHGQGRAVQVRRRHWRVRFLPQPRRRCAAQAADLYRPNRGG